MSHAQEGDPSHGEKIAVVFVATLSSFLMPFMASSLNVALPRIGAEFSMDAILLSWIVTAYLLVAGIFILPFGRLADIYGRKRLFTGGVAIFTLAAFLNAIAPSGIMLIGFRVLQGVGAAMMFGLGVAILTSVFPPGERGKMLGYNTAAVYAGLSCGPFFGGTMTLHFGWRSIFLANVCFGVMVLIIAVRYLKGEWAGAMGERFDLPGAVIYSITLVMVIYGFSLLPEITGGVLLTLGVIFLSGFVFWETRTEYPLLEMRLFRRNTVFAFSNLATLLHYGATATITFLMSLYLQYNRGLDPQTTGLILIIQPVIQTLLSPVAGKISDRVEPRVIASAGMGLTAVGLLNFIFISDQTPLPLISFNLGLVGLGFAFFASPNTNAIMNSVEKRLYGVASGTLGTMRIVGNMLSMGIVMMIISMMIGHVEITPQYHEEFLYCVHIAFSIFSIMCFAGIFASLARGKIHNTNDASGG